MAHRVLHSRLACEHRGYAEDLLDAEQLGDRRLAEVTVDQQDPAGRGRGGDREVHCGGSAAGPAIRRCDDQTLLPADNEPGPRAGTEDVVLVTPADARGSTRLQHPKVGAQDAITLGS